MSKDLSSFLEELSSRPGELKRVTREIRPQAFETTALMEHWDKRGQYFAALFEKPERVTGGPSEFPMVTNIFGSRERIAQAIGHPVEQSGLALSLEMARREGLSVPAEPITGPAPVQERVWTGAEADVGMLPIVHHYEKDYGPVLTMAVAIRDPDEGFYEISFAKTFYKDAPDWMGISLHTPHLERVLAKYWERGQAAPMINILGHHPAFFLGSLAATPFGNNDWDTIGAYMGEPLRLAPSVTWGEDFMVPADAEIIIEGEVPVGEFTVVDPFGEVTRLYQPQCIRQVFNVKAITARNGAIMQDIFSGHRGHWNLSAVPKEGSIYKRLQEKFGNIKAVHMPHSLCSRLGCYISIKKEKEGIAKQVGHAALLESSFFHWAVVVDEDVDVFNEQEVLWAVATYTNPMVDADIVKNSFTLFNTVAGFNKFVVDATRPSGFPFPERFKVPDEVMDAMRPEEW